MSFSFVISLLSLSYYHELLELYTRIASGFPLRCHSEWANYFYTFIIVVAHGRLDILTAWSSRPEDTQNVWFVKSAVNIFSWPQYYWNLFVIFITNSEVWFSLHAGKGNIHIFLQKDNSSQRIRKVKGAKNIMIKRICLEMCALKIKYFHVPFPF